MVIIYLALGSNIGNRRENINKAINLLKDKLMIEKISSIYETKAIEFIEQRNFYNLVLRAKTSLGPNELLSFVKIIERKLKRKKTIKNGPRIIDIDILLYSNQKIKQQNLMIPHPRMLERDFVMIPLKEIGKRITGNKIKQKSIIRMI